MAASNYTSFSSFPADLSFLHSMLFWVRNQIKEGQFNDSDIRRIEIALEEALVNIIHYAYSNEKGIIEITYNFFPHDHIEIIIKDYGVPFNPLKNKKKIDYSSSIEEKTEGGLGISFIQELTDKMDYTREGKANVLTLKKYFQNKHL